MKSKKAQEGIIVTVLLVLVAIAAVSVIAYFIINSVRSGTNVATDKAECLKVSISIDKLTNATVSNVILSRESEDVVIKQLNMYVNGKLNTAIVSIPNKLETASSTISGLKVGDTVRLNAVLNSTGFVCESGAEGTVVLG